MTRLVVEYRAWVVGHAGHLDLSWVVLFDLAHHHQVGEGGGVVDHFCLVVGSDVAYGKVNVHDVAIAVFATSEGPIVAVVNASRVQTVRVLEGAGYQVAAIVVSNVEEGYDARYPRTTVRAYGFDLRAKESSEYDVVCLFAYGSMTLALGVVSIETKDGQWYSRCGGYGLVCSFRDSFFFGWGMERVPPIVMHVTRCRLMMLTPLSTIRLPEPGPGHKSEPLHTSGETALSTIGWALR